MICPKCGTNNTSNSQFCRRCGYSFYDQGRQNPGNNQGPIPPPPDFGPEKDNSTNKILIGALIPIIVIALGLSGWFLYKGYILKRDIDDTTTEATEVTTEVVTEEPVTETVTVPTTQATTEVTTEASTVSEAQKLQESLKYCDNRYADYDAHNNTSDFHKMESADGSFSFSYPKFLFNNKEVEIEDDRITYRFWFDDGYGEECSLIYERYDDPGNSEKIVKRIQKNKIADMYEKDLYAPSFERKRDGITYHTAVAAGFADNSERRGIYTLICNDGYSTYIMEFRHPTDGSRDAHNHKDYIIDCIYRDCSFSITKLKAESYEKFKNDPER